MITRFKRRVPRVKKAGAALLATSLLSLGLVTFATGTSAAPVSTNVGVTCRGADAATIETLGLAKGLIGTDTIDLNLRITGDVPEQAGLDETINAAFNWTATMDQALIDQADGLIGAITISDIVATGIVRGPSTGSTFVTNGPNTTVTPKKGVASVLNIGTVGGEITTTGGGIITYRVGGATLSAALSVGDLSFNLKLTCGVKGSNLIAQTSVRDPNAPTFTPEIVNLEVAAGGTATVDLLGDIIAPGKTPLMPESLEIVDSPTAGQASIENGVFTFVAPDTAGTYSTTVQVCGEPNPDGGAEGINEVQNVTLGENWPAAGVGGGLDAAFVPRPIAFSLKLTNAEGEVEETPLIMTAETHPDFALIELIGGPLPTPNPATWASEEGHADFLAWALGSRYKPFTTAQLQSAIESLPSVGAGNVSVTEIADGEGPVTGYSIEFIGELAETDVPALELGAWLSVPPQEILDAISSAISGLSSMLGGDEDEEAGPPGPFDGRDANNAADRDYADQWIADKVLAGLNPFDPSTGPTEEDWSAWLEFRLINPLISEVIKLVPELLAFINSLFPQKLMAITIEQGEAGSPPEPLCAQGIIDVTVLAAEVDPTATSNTPDVLAAVVARQGDPLSFTG